MAKTREPPFDALLREYAALAESGELCAYLKTYRSKPLCRAWIAENAPQVRVPVAYATCGSIAEADFESLPGRFVIKPVQAANARGMFCLERLSPGLYYDHARDEQFTAEGICRRYEEERAASRVSYTKKVRIEERIADAVSDGIPMDYKFHCFRGECPMVMQRYVPPGGKFHDYRFRFLDPEWNDLGPIKFADRLGPDLPCPPLWREAFDAARTISARIDFPFMRVDLYVTPTEIMFGELAPFPNGGKDYFTPEWDRRLGAMWQAVYHSPMKCGG